MPDEDDIRPWETPEPAMRPTYEVCMWLNTSNAAPEGARYLLKQLLAFLWELLGYVLITDRSEVGCSEMPCSNAQN